MHTKRVALIFAGLLIVAALGACAPLPPATTEAPTVAATAVVTAEPTATEAPAATPTPALPDPKTDPQAALLYSSAGEMFKTAEFTYDMTMTMAPADDASKDALGDEAAEIENFKMNLAGTGAMDMTDPENVKMRMDMDMSAAGQDISIEMVMIGKTAWIKMPGQDEWTKAEGDQALSTLPTGITPDQMLEDFENAVDVEWIEDTTLNGEEVSHLRFTMDPSKMDLEALTGDAMLGQEMTPEQLQELMKDMKPVVDVWLSKATLQPRGQKMQLDWVMGLPEDANMGDAKLRITMLMDAEYSKVNEPVTIEAPAD
ncbi:MAG: hypothetical protein MUC34_09940 [Anaerolineae bacterium]|jgi:hypothetical protein|nr:hypothetical protein [Anaerolineae bacterium]